MSLNPGRVLTSLAVSVSFAVALSATPHAQSSCSTPRADGIWCPGDLVLGVGQPDSTGTSSRYDLFDQNRVPLPALSIRDASGVGWSGVPSSWTGACAQDPTTGDLFTAGVNTNLVSQIKANTRSPFSWVDATSDVRTNPACDTSNPGNGCGAVESVVFDRAGNYYVGTVAGANQILKYSPGSPNPVKKYAVQVGTRGANWLDLSVDQITTFYTSYDNTIRVFRLDGSPLGATLAKDGVTPLVDLVAAGVKVIADPIGYDPTNPRADSNGFAHLDPNHEGLFGEIPITLYAAPAPTANPASALRLLPPGDGTGGILVAVNAEVVWTALDGTPKQGFNDVGAFGFFGVNITPDGKFFWTATSTFSGSPSQLFKFHIPTGQRVDGPVSPSSAVVSMCVMQEYAAGATQPDCRVEPGHELCSPVVNCLDPGQQSDPQCKAPMDPVLQMIPDQFNAEGDVVGPIPVIASSPAGHTLTYEVGPLPTGVTFDPVTHSMSGIVDFRASEMPAYTVTVTVRDSTDPNRLKTRKSFVWTIADMPAPPVVAVSSPLTLTTYHGEPASIVLSATDADRCDHLTFSLQDPTPLPPGVGFNFTPLAAELDTCNDSNRVFTATLSGTPATPRAAPYTVTVVVDDGFLRWPDRIPSHRQTVTLSWTVANRPPVVTGAPSTPRITQLGSPGTLTVAGSDPDRDAVTLVATGVPPGIKFTATTSANPNAVSSDTSANPAGVFSVDPSVAAQPGDFPVTVQAVDAFGATSPVQAFTWSVRSTPPNNPPTCSTATASPSVLWPPNHKLAPIAIGGVTDPDGDPIKLSVTRILQDEPPTSADFNGDNGDSGRQGSDDRVTFVRAERMGNGDGRVYEIRFTADDERGGACSGTVFVGVPRDKNSVPVDSKVRFDAPVALKKK